MENYSGAEKLYLEALAVYDRKFDNRYSGYGLTSARLGALYLQQKKLSDAENYLINAEGIIKSTFGAQHPYSVDLQVQLGVLYWLKDDIGKADKNFTMALDKSLEFVGHYFAPMSDTEKAMYWKTLQPRFEKYYAFTAAVSDETINHNAIQYRLATKSMLLSGTTKVKDQILQSGDGKLIEDYQTWLDQKGSLAHYYAMSQEDLKDQNVNLDSIERAANTLEKSLSEQSGLFSAAYNSSTPTVKEIQSKLMEGEKAIEIIHVSSGINNKTAYLALVISPDRIEKITLSNGDELDDKYFKLYRNLIRLKKDDNYSYEQYWQPIDNIVGDAKKVYISLDGVYNQISINSLQVSENQYLIDKRSYVIVSSLRDLRSEINTLSAHKKSAALFGNPLYGSVSIDPLPGTGKEVIAVKGILDKSGYSSKLEVGEKATENNIKGIAEKGLVHIATHGFFVADPKGDQNSVFSIPLYNINENILLRSGLLMAGAGNHKNERNTLSAADNGILTSYEVLNMNLDNTDLVVLSACETGLGDVMAGEGVFGLQRAFMVAGASNVIMSLWKVDDEATQKLMVLFYKNWLQSGNMEIAFTKAQKEVKELYKHPYYWGSFVLLRN
jgi:CHAT domain-containing protein